MRTAALWSSLTPYVAFLLTGYAPPRAEPADVRLTIATLHAATLSTSRAEGDASDGPFLLVSMLGPGTRVASVELPKTGHLSIHRDEALGPQPLVELRLAPGDSVRLLVSVLESVKVEESAERWAATASARAFDGSTTSDTVLASALAPLTKQGAHWLGSATLLVTNEGGVTHWRTLECVSTCRVIAPPPRSEMQPSDSSPVSGVVELTGSGGTYHLQLQGRRTS